MTDFFEDQTKIITDMKSRRNLWIIWKIACYSQKFISSFLEMIPDFWLILCEIFFEYTNKNNDLFDPLEIAVFCNIKTETILFQKLLYF